ncbi:MAG: NUDIX domain-containing protein [Chloroflexota bacterium]|jgi:8-oxo-dGTP diphosphatase
MGRNDQGLQSAGQRYQAVPRVLVFLRNGDDVLLLKGAPNKRIWANKYNGVGGHVEFDEDIISAARREVLEETGLTIRTLDLAAVVNINAGNESLGILMFVFVAWSEQRDVKASHEGALHWVPVSRLPKGELVEDLEWLLPRVLIHSNDGPPQYLYYHYNENDQLVIESADVHG